jgi:uncharacterized protein YcgI (DUF1989 family)
LRGVIQDAKEAISFEFESYHPVQEALSDALGATPKQDLSAYHDSIVEKCAIEVLEAPWWQDNDGDDVCSREEAQGLIRELKEQK